jgi:hypothetical protein
LDHAYCPLPIADCLLPIAFNQKPRRFIEVILNQKSLQKPSRFGSRLLPIAFNQKPRRFIEVILNQKSLQKPSRFGSRLLPIAY